MDAKEPCGYLWKRVKLSIGPIRRLENLSRRLGRLGGGSGTFSISFGRVRKLLPAILKDWKT